VIKNKQKIRQNMLKLGKKGKKIKKKEGF